MSHEITNDRDMAYTGDTPWHGLGTSLPPGATVEDWVKSAGLEFNVAKAPVWFRPGAESALLHDFRNKSVAYREDNGFPLGVVSTTGYKIHQPREIANTLREWAKAAGVTIETMGSLKGGRRIWALARLDHEIKLPGNDVTRPYFLISTGYDGETGTVGTFTMIRVVCWNTISAALEIYRREEDAAKAAKKQLVTGFNISHNSEFDPVEAAKKANQLYQAAIQYEARANLLAATGVSEEQALEYFLSLVGSIDKKSGDLTKQSRAKVECLVKLYHSGPGAELKSAKGTAFGLLNAITRFADHEAKERGVGGRLVSAWYGAGKDLKAEAMVKAQELVAA